MILYRIARKQFAEDLSGEGGLKSEARWHDRMAILYTSVSSSTAILEKLVHMDKADIHNDLMMIELTIPDGVSSQILAVADLPDGWNSNPAPEILKKIGNAWLTIKSALLLFVPSVIDPYAQNVLINPGHPESVNIKVSGIKPFVFDIRIRKLNTMKD